jgi:long-chain acyl-CoA synthetase
VTGSGTVRLTLHEQLVQTVAEGPDRPVVLVDGGGGVTAGELLRRTASVARALGDHGRGARLAVVAHEQDFVGFVVACHAGYRLGACVVPLSARLTAEELADALSDVAATTVIVVGSPAGDRVSGAVELIAARRGPAPASIVHLDDLLSRNLPPAAEPGTFAADDLAYLVRTSGTTGRPKLVAVSYGNLCAQYPVEPWSDALAATVLMTASIGSEATQALVHDCVRGPTVVIPPTFDARRHCELIELHRPSVVGLVPSSAIAVLHVAEGHPYDLSSVRCVVSSSAPLPPAVFAELAERFPGATVYNAYALSEGVALVNDFAHGRPDSVGRPGPDTQLRIVDEHGDAAAPGTVGEIWLRHPGEPPRRHLGEVGAQGTRITPDGWVATGDLGRVDADGYVYFVDRRDDIIVTAGHNVSSVEVEAVLATDHRVRQAAVVGVPDPVLGSAIVAAVITAAPVDPAELHRLCAARLAPAKRPSAIRVVDELPLTATGKVRKEAVRRMVTAPAGIAGAGGVLDAVLAGWTTVTGTVPDLDADLFDAGGHSLLAARLAVALSVQLAVQVPLALVLDQRTPRQVATVIAGELAAGRLARRRMISPRPA